MAHLVLWLPEPALSGMPTTPWTLSMVQIVPQSAKTCPERHLFPHLTCKKFSLFKANFLHLKDLEKNIREPLDCIGIQPMLDIHIGDSGQDMKIQMAVTCNEHGDYVPRSSPQVQIWTEEAYK